MPFAIGAISGLIPDCSKARKSPLLEIPSCTESEINNIFFFVTEFS